MRYEGHRPKHARLHSHGRPSPPHARQSGNVQDAAAPISVQFSQLPPNSFFPPANPMPTT